MGAFGLQSHIWANNTRSILLLAGFPVLLLLLLFALSVGYIGLVEAPATTGEGLALAAAHLARVWPFAFVAAALWFAVAWLFHAKIIEATVGSRGLERKDAPELYNLLENLCISRGLATPRLAVIETPALNAFASGVSDKTYAVTVTRGLLEALDKAELEAVLAHELTHIRNRDVRLLIVATIFVGIFSFVGELVFRNTFRPGLRMGGHMRSRRGDSRGGGALILIAIATIAIAYILAIVVRFALSRKREFLADAGAVDLTRNPDAMISALRKISGRSEIDAPADIREMMLDNPTKPFASLFMTHPTIEARIDALSRYAGGRA